MYDISFVKNIRYEKKNDLELAHGIRENDKIIVF